jgi:hypothetical protein
MPSANPLDELFARQIPLRQVADFAAWNGIIGLIPKRAVHPIDAVVNVLRTFLQPALSVRFNDIARRAAAIVAILKREREEFSV